jgi:hypothetical protein
MLRRRSSPFATELRQVAACGKRIRGWRESPISRSNTLGYIAFCSTKNATAGVAPIPERTASVPSAIRVTIESYSMAVAARSPLVKSALVRQGAPFHRSYVHGAVKDELAQPR